MQFNKDYSIKKYFLKIENAMIPNILAEATKEKSEIENQLYNCSDMSLKELLIKQKELPKQLCGDFIFDNSINIFFGGTGLGKSLLAFQICDLISKGESIDPFTNQIGAQDVLYFNLEMSPAQLKARYHTNEFGDYQFQDNFRIISDVLYDNERELSLLIEEKIKCHNPGFVVLDNISFVSTDKEKSENAKLLMKQLKDLQREFKISILAIGHTPKVPLNTELSLSHLAGSSNLSNFADSVFAIGRSSQGSGKRYLKMLKNRMSSGSERVFTFEINAQSNFLHFDFTGMDFESTHLRRFTGDELQGEIKKLGSEGKSIREIANLLNCSTTTVQKYKKEGAYDGICV